MRRTPLPLALALGLAMIACAAPAARTMRVVATDYALQTADSAPAGRVELVFENRGRVPHEVVVGLFRSGATPEEMLAGAQAGLRVRDLPEHYLDGAPFGVLFAWPGKTSLARLDLDLESGKRYALLCTFRDSTAAPEHAALGMVRILYVY
jgi:hypothetical protein